MRHDDDPDRDPLDAFLAEEPMPLPPLAPDGGFQPGLYEPEPIPPVTAATMICLRDCRHYIEIHTRFQHGNAKGTLVKEPVQVNRYCRCIDGADIELTDELVRECSEWDPRSKDLIDQRTARRDLWLADHPLVQIGTRPAAS